MLGNFSLRSTHEAFDVLDDGFDALPIGLNTTRSPTDHEYASPYDQIRLCHGRDWDSVDDLTDISGIGAGTVNNIRESELVCDKLL